MSDQTPPRTLTAFERIGGRPAVRSTVDRFYDLMGDDLLYAELRALHAADLEPMRDSLTGFLTAWLGGPRDWFAQHPGKCIMSTHHGLQITGKTAGQWVGAMNRAIDDSIEDKEIATRMAEALGRMAAAMAPEGQN
jgi:hemoglobin